FIVTSILKSASLATVVERHVAQSIKAYAGAPGMPVEITAEQSAESKEATVVTFSGQSQLTFAFQAVRLIFEDGVYTDYASAHGLTGYAWATGAAPAEGMLLLDDDLNEISE